MAKGPKFMLHPYHFSTKGVPSVSKHVSFDYWQIITILIAVWLKWLLVEWWLRSIRSACGCRVWSQKIGETKMLLPILLLQSANHMWTSEMAHLFGKDLNGVMAHLISEREYFLELVADTGCPHGLCPHVLHCVDFLCMVWALENA